jgi:hypothetical protein
MPFTFTIDITAEDDEEQIKMGKVLVSIGQALAGPSHAVIRAAEITEVSNVVTFPTLTVGEASVEETARRKRRTKAEIAADEARERNLTVLATESSPGADAVMPHPTEQPTSAVSDELAAIKVENEKAIVPAVGKDHVVAEVDNSDAPIPPTAAVQPNGAEEETNRVKLRAVAAQAMGLGLAPTITDIFIKHGGQGPKSVPADCVLVACAEIEELIAVQVQ